MEKLQNQILSEINDFLRRDLSRREHVECVILCGSYATGKATQRSDVDLCYIAPFSDFSRESLNYGGREYQLMIAPWSWYEHVISEYERKGNVGTITVMLAKGICLRGDNEKWRDLHQLALHYHDIGPKPPSDDEIQKIKVRISDLLDDLHDAVDPTIRKWICVEILRECVDAHFVLRGWWAVKTKYQLEELRIRDGVMAYKVQACLESSLGNGDKNNALNDLYSHVFGPFGW